MKYILILFGFILISNKAQADFVDIATISVNGKTIRKVTNNSSEPYLVNLSKYQIGDTLKISVWTDYGGEMNSFITIKNNESLKIDTLTNNGKFIINSDVLIKKHSVTVHYVSYDNEKQIATWNICTIIPDEKIELVYKKSNELRDYLISTIKKTKINPSILADSIFMNFKLVTNKNGSVSKKILTDTIQINKQLVPKQLNFNKDEKLYIEEFNSIDYFQLYNLFSEIHGTIKINQPSLNDFIVVFGSYKYKYEFHFIYKQNEYFLSKIFYFTI